MKKLNYNLINYTLVSIIVFLVVLSRSFWFDALGKIFGIIIPFLIAFAIAYAFYPFLKYLEKEKIPKWLAITFITLLFMGLISLIVSLLTPLVYEQVIQLLNNTIDYINKISINNGWDLNNMLNSFVKLDKLVGEGSKFVTNSAFNIINLVVSFFTTSIIVFFSFIYFLVDMDKIREFIKDIFKNNKKRYNYVKNLDFGIKNYIVGTFKFIGVQIIEYPLCFYLIGHPYYLILGILASLTSIIPIFGGFIVGLIALITSLVISTNLFWATLVVVVILSSLDGYFWSPKIYGKANNMHPLLIIFGVFAGGALLGFWGIVVALPITIIISESIKYFKKNKN